MMCTYLVLLNRTYNIYFRIACKIFEKVFAIRKKKQCVSANREIETHRAARGQGGARGTKSQPHSPDQKMQLMANRATKPTVHSLVCQPRNRKSPAIHGEKVPTKLMDRNRSPTAGGVLTTGPVRAPPRWSSSHCRT